MSYNNKMYNTRFSGCYNTPGQFVPAAETYQQQPQQGSSQVNTNLQSIETNMEAMDTGSVTVKSEQARPHWMKPKLAGVKKVSNRERRRRQNENLRRLLSPKNALMVLNEMLPNEQVANQFTVESAPPSAQYFKAPGAHGYCAALSIHGNSYKGYGENKMSARNAAAEQAIRDLIIKRMQKAAVSDSASTVSEPSEEEALPMIQLASFALHKLFAEWEYDGHKVPQLRPLAAALIEQVQSEPARKALPGNAAQMHPCMLLTYMRPQLEYRELGAAGDRPQNMEFTMGVDVDGTTYIGKASSKKEARKLAAKSACRELFGVTFEPAAAAAVPTPAAQ